MFQILCGDAANVLSDLPEQSVQTVITSPPYWGLRDYGVAGQIGLELSASAYIDNIVAVFRQVRRVLADNGTVWLNLGDSYAGGGNYRGIHSENTLTSKQSSNRGARGVSQQLGARDKDAGVSPKNLVGIPWRTAIALQADGWILRSDIIWAKPNPMPESVTDRPTRAHEYIFLLSKSKTYYYDADTIKEPYAESTLREMRDGYKGNATKDYKAANAQDPSETKKRVIESLRRRVGMVEGARVKTAEYIGKHGTSDSQSAGRRLLLNAKKARDNGAAHGMPFVGGGRNKRSVWWIPPQPFKGAHFATFPEKLVEPCVLAGSRPGDTVLDPFCGSGRAGIVAVKHGREFIGIDLNPEYCAMAVCNITEAQELCA